VKSIFVLTHFAVQKKQSPEKWWSNPSKIQGLQPDFEHGEKW